MTRVLLVLLVGIAAIAAPRKVTVAADLFETTTSVVVRQQAPTTVLIVSSGPAFSLTDYSRDLSGT